MPATLDDRVAVRALLGRDPAAEFEVVVRSSDGAPVVIRNAPFTEDGTPMPTRYWLVGADWNRAVSRLEAAGGVREAEAVIDAAAIARALRSRARCGDPGALDGTAPVGWCRRHPHRREVPARALRLAPGGR